MLQRIESGRGDPDGPRHHGLGPGADHRQLPVRARATRWRCPIGSIIAKFRPELEAYIEAARERAGSGALEDVVALGVADDHAGPMPALS